MRIKRLLPCFITALLIFPAFAFSQTEEIKEYKVKKGDTLWDISNKELQDPFLWPKIWKENPGVNNPDRIYPKQSIKIPLYLIQKEKKEELVVESAPEPIVEKESTTEAMQKAELAPIEVRPLVDANLFIASGYIATGIDDLGIIAGSPSRKNLFGINDFVYLTTKEPANIGDKFYVVRKTEVIHPVKKTRVGELVQILGVAEVAMIKQGETVAKILKSYQEVIIGNLLIPYSYMTPPVVPKPYRKPKIEGYIVAAYDMRQNNAMFDIVYLDKGKDAGLEVGDVLRAISVEKQVEGLTKVEHKYPHGVVQLIKVYDTTSVAVIRQSIDSVLPGYLVIQYD
jgi:LysM repeat protein